MNRNLKTLVAMILAIVMLFSTMLVIAEEDGGSASNVQAEKKSEETKEAPKEEPKAAPKEEPKEEPKEAPKEEPKEEPKVETKPEPVAKAEESAEHPAEEKKDEPVEIYVVEVVKEHENTTTEGIRYDNLEEAEKASNKDSDADPNNTGEVVPSPTVEPTDGQEPELDPELTPDPEATIEPEPVERSVSVSSTLGNAIEPGESFTLKAQLTGFDGVSYDIYWQYNDGKRWITYSDSNDLSVSVKATIETVNYSWRVCVIVKSSDVADA